MADKDPPLEVLPDSGMYVGTVIDLDQVRIRLGRTPWKAKACEHGTMIYCPSERRIWCEECERTIDSFDAFYKLTGHLQKMLSEAAAKLARANEALRSAARLRATKTLDRLWAKKMVPCCPHCRAGLLADDFADGAAASMSIELELARRNRERTNAANAQSNATEQK